MSPDGSKSLPPEERLLRLIRGKGGGASPPPKTSAAAQAPPAAPQVPPAANTVRARSAAWEAPAWSLTAINVALGCVAVALLMAIALVALAPSPAQRPAAEESVAGAPSEPSVSESSSAEAPVGPAMSLSAVAARPLFVSPASPGGASAPLASVPLSQQAKDLAGRLSVLGIVEGEPRQAIIEDAQTKKTYFVSAGQQVVEGMVVAEVRTDRVILDLDGQRLELSL